MAISSERAAVQQSISFNPVTLTVDRPASANNSRGVPTVDFSSLTPTALTNSVRIVLSKKPGSKVIEGNGKYINEKAYFIISDYETEIKKHDRFTWNNRDWEIMDIDRITFEGALKNYQAELKETTQSNV